MNAKQRAHLEAQVKQLPLRPGVYQMLDASGKVLYVGKARKLRHRVQQYLHVAPHLTKTMRMMGKVVSIKTMITRDEREALLLEYQCIQRLKPRYNVIFRDDKSYLYIRISHDPFPRLHACRKKGLVPDEKGEYFGPYTQVQQVRATLALLYQIFQLRQCNQHTFRHRTRPCLQYQMQRCSAPCVGRIDTEAYGKTVDNAKYFLRGKCDDIIQALIDQMERASQELHYEKAALLRDQIQQLRQVQQQSAVCTQTKQSVDIIAVQQTDYVVLIQLLFIRNGGLREGCHYTVERPLQQSLGEVLDCFLSHFYLKQNMNTIPNLILIPFQDAALDWTMHHLEQSGPKPSCRIRIAKKPIEKQWQLLAEENAQYALQQVMRSKARWFQAFLQLQTLLDLPNVPYLIQCWDISHMQGDAVVGVGVMFDQQGPAYPFFRLFNIKGITAGDDYAALRHALERYYHPDKKNRHPDILLMDGGRGQLRCAYRILKALSCSNIIVMGIAKDTKRTWGREHVWLQRGEKMVLLSPDRTVLHLLLRIRDSAHHFALHGHRKKQQRKLTQSGLESISGIGSKRRQQLLTQFGGMQGLQVATVEQLKQVPGISVALAERIAQYLLHHRRS